jgi:hypothetical protein
MKLSLNVGLVELDVLFFVGGLFKVENDYILYIIRAFYYNYVCCFNIMYTNIESN